MEPRKTTAEEGSVVVLNCMAHGDPEPEMIWRKEQIVLQNDDHFTILPNNSLRCTISIIMLFHFNLYHLNRILGARISDSGIYMCMAKNRLGSLAASAELTIQGTICVYQYPSLLQE